jgi:hypothetical protein
LIRLTKKAIHYTTNTTTAGSLCNHRKEVYYNNIV